MNLDADGMPENAMFYLDIRNGKAYFRGDIHAENGYFRGEVHATSGEFTGTLKAAILDGKLVGTKNGEVDLSDVDYIDLGGMILDGRPGSTGITFRPGYEPVKYQFATTASGPWHDTMQTNDKYRRDSLDGGTTWGSAYQFRGSDGKNGSDAKVPAYIQSTYIDATKVESFHIKANKMEAVVPAGSENDTETGFILTGAYENTQLRYLRIYSYPSYPAPRTVFTSPQGAYAEWDFDKTDFSGNIDFSSATVTGLHFTLA